MGRAFGVNTYEHTHTHTHAGAVALRAGGTCLRAIRRNCCLLQIRNQFQRHQRCEYAIGCIRAGVACGFAIGLRERRGIP
jgi:hypothetical protein